MRKTFNHYAEEPLFPFFCLALTALLAEFMAAAVFYLTRNLPLGVTLHAAVIWLLLLSAYYNHGRGKARLSLFLLVMTAASGPFGAAVCLVAVIVYRFSPRASLSPEQWVNSFLEAAPGQGHDLLHERLGMGLENTPDYSRVEPFPDILNNGTTLQKQIAIARMTRHFRPQFAPLLLRAVQDTNAVVRVQAATAMVKIEHDFMEKYLRLKKSLKEFPDDTSTGLDFAGICDSYAHAGLLDEAANKDLRMQAIEIYTRHLENSDHPTIKLQLARLYLRDNQPEKTCGLLYGPVKSGKASPAMVFWYMEALFRLKKFAQLRLLISHYAPALRKFSGYKPQEETIGLLSVWKGDNMTEGETYAA